MFLELQSHVHSGPGSHTAWLSTLGSVRGVPVVGWTDAGRCGGTHACIRLPYDVHQEKQGQCCLSNEHAQCSLVSLFFCSSLQSFACCCELLRAAPPLTREQANPLLSLITKFSSTVCFVDHYIGPTRAKRRRHSHNFFFLALSPLFLAVRLQSAFCLSRSAGAPAPCRAPRTCQPETHSSKQLFHHDGGHAATAVAAVGG